MRMRMILGLLLSLVVTLGSFSMAVARSQAPGGSAVTICAGYGVVTVTLDAEGRPVGPVHLCPDCVAAFALAHMVSPVSVLRPATRGAPLGQVLVWLKAGSAEVQPQARGPPVSFS